MLEIRNYIDNKYKEVLSQHLRQCQRPKNEEIPRFSLFIHLFS